MIYAVIADIHSNLEAFSAVLNDVEERGGASEIWCLGDVVGYGSDPHRCIELLQSYPNICIAGNHDLAAIGKIDTAYFNQYAAAAAEWTSKNITTEDRQYLEELPLSIEKDDFTMAHGSPREPVWEYIFSLSIARENFDRFQTKYCLVGHTHAPAFFRENADGTCSSGEFSSNIKLAIGKDRLIINPGGVGQPRDGDPRASYTLCDSKTGMFRLFRVPYDIEATQEKMMREGLPVPLVARLSRGE